MEHEYLAIVIIIGATEIELKDLNGEMKNMGFRRFSNLPDCEYHIKSAESQQSIIFKIQDICKKYKREYKASITECIGETLFIPNL